MARRTCVTLMLVSMAVAVAGCEDEPDAVAARETVLGCSRHVVTAPGRPGSDRRQDFVAGPVVFHGLKGEARRTRTHPEAVARSYADGEGVVKVLAGVRGGTRSRIAVAPGSRGSAGLTFGTSPDPRVPRDSLDMAERAVEFRACLRPRTYFAGGLLIARAHCLRLLVSTPGRAPRRHVLAYGVSPRSC